MAATGPDVACFASTISSIVGLAGIPGRLPMILRRIRQTTRRRVAARPDVLVIIDSPDFTHRVARRVRKAHRRSRSSTTSRRRSGLGGRAARGRCARYVDHVLALLPFEPEAISTARRPALHLCRPSAGRSSVDDLRPERRGTQSQDPPLLLVLPGSRSSEIRRLAGIFGRPLNDRRPAVAARSIWPCPTTAASADQVVRATAHWPVRPRIVVPARRKVGRRSAMRAPRWLPNPGP